MSLRPRLVRLWGFLSPLQLSKVLARDNDNRSLGIELPSWTVLRYVATGVAAYAGLKGAFVSQDIVPPAQGFRRGTGFGVPSLLLPLAFISFVLILLGCTLPYITGTESMESPSSFVGPFRLVDGNGQVVTDHSWPGKFLLVYFGYTRCPDLCPTMLATEAATLQQLGEAADRVQPLFVTIDPQRDTPAVLKQYTALFSPRILGLTGTSTNLGEAAEEYGVRYARQKTGPGPNDYEMEHSGFAYLVYPSGDLALTVPPGQTPSQMKSALSSFLE
jgi:protein SCO1/2